MTIRELQEAVAFRIRDFLGVKAASNREERALRLLEEAAELAQAEGVTEAIALRVLRRVFTRPVGDVYTEGADVGLTFLAWSYAAQIIDPIALVKRRLDETADKRDKIRASAQRKADEGIGIPPGIESGCIHASSRRNE